MRLRLVPQLLLFLLLMCLPGLGTAAPVSAPLVPGLSVTAVTSPLVTTQVTSFPLLTTWKSSGVTAVETYDAASQRMLRAELNGDGNPSGADFSLVENSALYVYSTQQNTLSLGNTTSCASLNLATGFNLAAYACFPPNYLASEFINSVGLANIISISRLDQLSGRWQTAAVDGGMVVGDDFPLVAGEGYVIHSAVVSGWIPPAIGLAPASLTVWPGEPGVTLTVTLPYQAPAGGTAVDCVSSDPALVVVAPTVTVPQGATTASVPLTMPDTGSVAPQTVTVRASRNGLTSAQAVLSVRPKPTINLSPPTTLTGLNFTYPLTVSLNDIAPPGGLPVALAATPPGIVTVPASVTVPAGASSTQVTVTALSTLGSATISASSPGRGISGSQHSVTVQPIQNMTYNPLISAQVGVQVGPVATAPTSANPTYTPISTAEVGVQVGPVFTGPSPIQAMNYGPVTSSPVGVQVGDNSIAPTSVSATYASLASVEVGVAVGPVVTGVSPTHGAIGDTAIPLTISGYGLDGVTAIAFQPATGITVGTLSVVPDGLSVTVPIDIAANALVGARTVLLSNAGGVIMAARGGADIFNVTLPTPQIDSISPLRSMVGQAVTMTIVGTNFNSASSVNFTPSTGIVVSNPPTVNGNGASVTVSFIIAANAALGNRVVTVTTPGGTTSTIADVTNTFSVTDTTDPGFTHTSVTPEVGVLVETTALTTTRDVPYGPTASPSIGVTVGSTITSIAPVSGNIGSTGLVVRALGVGLSTATGISFYPPDGITVQPSSFAIGGDGNPQVTIDIAADAPVSPRTVLVALQVGGYALPTDAGSNQFRVTLPVPTISSLQPIRAMVGQAVAMTIFGTNFGSASSVDFTPATGITVINPPTISADGTMITTSFTIAANAPLGDRVVTVTTPGGTSSAVASTANTFSVTSDLGTTYTPLVSSQVGVLVSTATAGNQVNMGYGPLTSAGVGVMVTPTAAPTSQNLDYGPLVSTEVGVAVGGVFTGLSPAAMEPGSSATFTLTGVGLDAVTEITVIPAANLTVTAWTPAGDGRSGTVAITADSGAAQGVHTLVPLVGSTALAPSAPGVGIMQVGYKPVVNSITTSYPTSSVLAVTGSTVTLTLNGDHLQGATRVEVIPSDGVTIDTVPFWFNDGSEHVRVTLIVAANAVAGDRLVRLTTPYGSSSAIRDATNTLSIVLTVGSVESADADNTKIAANESSSVIGNDSITVARIIELTGVSGRKLDALLLPPLQRFLLNVSIDSVAGISRELLITAAELPDASRGPPKIIG